MQDGSDLEQLQAKSEEVVPRGRGRPKKYASHITVNVVQKKLRKFDEKENYVFPASLMAKKKRKTHIYNIWYFPPYKGSETIAATTPNKNSIPSAKRSAEWAVPATTEYSHSYIENHAALVIDDFNGLIYPRLI